MEPEPPARPPEGGFYDLVIGEFANRTDTVPATFRREALDIRRRLPDRRVGGTISVGAKPVCTGLQSPRAMRLRSGDYVNDEWLGNKE